MSTTKIYVGVTAYDSGEQQHMLIINDSQPQLAAAIPYDGGVPNVCEAAFQDEDGVLGYAFEPLEHFDMADAVQVLEINHDEQEQQQ